MRKYDLKQNKKRGNSQAGSSNKLPPVNHKKEVSSSFTLNTSNHQDDGLISLIHQYFIKNNFLDSLEAFQRDCVKGFKPTTKTMEQLKKELINLFDSGNRQQFMSRFMQYVPLSMRSKDSQTMKIEFYIQLYFFVYSIHPQLGKKKSIDAAAKQSFISYLEGRGSILSKNNEFLQYYALAYLQKPQQHPTFKVIFTKQWLQQLRKRVVYYMDKLYPNGKLPALVNMYDKFIENNLDKMSNVSFTQPQQEPGQIQEEIQVEESMAMAANLQPVLHQKNTNGGGIKKELLNEQMETLKQKYAELEEERLELVDYIENLKNKHQNLQNKFQDFSDAAQATLMESQSKWFKITQQIYTISDDLLNVCNKFQEGKPLSDPQIVKKIEQKLKKFEKFINLNVEDLFSDNVDFSLFQRPENTDHDASVDQRRGNHKLCQLDFDKIKACFALQSDNPQHQQNKCILLQALRWRITKIRGALSKRQVVLSFTLNDIFGLKKKDKTMDNLLFHSGKKCLLQTTLIINALSKDYYGRDYISCEYLIKQYISLFKNPQTQQIIKNQILIALQWLSNRRLPQLLMIQNDIIKLLVNKLDKERESLSSQLMEYVTGLLLNLLLHKKGAAKAQQILSQILMALINLMESDQMTIRSYVHGALYPLLSRKVFKEKAKEFGMQQNIKYLLQNGPQNDIQHQLKYLQQRLQSDTVEPQKEEEEQDQNDQDQIYDEDFGDEHESISEEVAGSLSGEQLLMKDYLLTGPQSITQMNYIKEEAQTTLKKISQFDNSFYERQSANTPLMGRARKNISNNNSVYSNKSSNRILKSEMNSRSQMNNKAVRQKLDTVHQNNSQVSIKEFPQEKKNPSPTDNLKQESKKVEQEPNEQTFRPNANESNLFKGSFQQSKVRNHVEQSGSFQRPVEVKVYETTPEYKDAFATRAKLVRTPPQK